MFPVRRTIGFLPPLLCFLLSLAIVFASPQTHMVPMRDGVKLATDVYLPDGEGPWPTVFLRFPYNKALGAGIGPEATKRGYAFVSQDTRGRYASEGENLPFDADGHADGKWDGYDSAEWISQQSWCNGEIGTWGASAGAITQYFLAGTGHPSVVVQQLTVGTPSLFHDGIYRGGIFRKSMVEDWLKSTKFEDYALDLWVTNYPYTQYWKDREITQRYDQVNAVGVHIGGWFDIFAQSTIDAFLGYQELGGENARGKQKLIMGPWTHGVLQNKAGELTYPNGNAPPDGLHDPWRLFAATLLEQDNGFLDGPTVTYYVMGASGEPDAPGNEWRASEVWPPEGRTMKRLFLHSDGRARFDGSETKSMTYVSDPANPVPSIGGYELTLPAGPRNQQQIETRDDVLVFTTDPLPEPLEVTGNVIANVEIKTDAPDTDVIVRMCDVYPDGRSFNICEGALRLSLRNAMSRHDWLTPNDRVSVAIKLWPTSMIFNKGHRLRVHIASTSSPALEPNLQNGQPPRTGDPRIANNTVWLGGEEGSFLELPVIELR